MGNKTRIGILICDRYRSCAGGKCFQALREKTGAFEAYAGKEVEVAGFTTCGGCPGGNIEYAPEEMKKNGVQIIHLATGFLVGYPPCPFLKQFVELIPAKFGIRVVVGTHPIPQKYYEIHRRLGSWREASWASILKPCLSKESVRIAYD